MCTMGFYRTKEWRRARRQALHDYEWRCCKCGCDLVGMGRAAHVHHRKALKRARALATEPLNLLPLCRDCHFEIEHEERSGPIASIDGSPMSPQHPWNLKNTGGPIKSEKAPMPG